MRYQVLILTALLCGPAKTSIAQDVHFSGELKNPSIARFKRLPMRMLDEVQIRPGTTETRLDPQIIPFMTKQLEPNVEPDLQFEAAKSLDQIARGKHGDISVAVPKLIALLESPNRNVRRAAAMTLVSANAESAAAGLLKVCESADDRLRSLIEPTLAEWSFQPAADVWKSRLSDMSNSPTSLSLAAHGLSAVGTKSDVALIQSLLENPNVAYQARHASAQAICQLDGENATRAGAKLATGSMTDRLLAAATANSKTEAALNLLSQLCDDTQNAVAARAWTQLAALDPNRLQSKIDAGIAHPDSGVRMAAVSVMSKYPNSVHTDALGKLLGDIHIQVRNKARVVLLDYAANDKTLHDQIVANAENAVKANESWQRIEQSLVIAAILNQTQFTELSVPLLEHERDEVSVTAAWLMHLYPNALVMDDVTEIADRRFELRTQQNGPNVDLQLAFLFQTAGYVEHKPMQPLAEKQFSKGSGLSRDGRSAAMWAIGMMNRDNPEPSLVGKLAERMKDRDSQVPELDQVRRMAVMSLGRMGAKDQVDEIRVAYRVEVPPTVIPESARWALRQLGESDIPPERPLGDTVLSVGGWNIYPVERKQAK